MTNKAKKKSLRKFVALSMAGLMCMGTVQFNSLATEGIVETVKEVAEDAKELFTPPHFENY